MHVLKLPVLSIYSLSSYASTLYLSFWHTCTNVLAQLRTSYDAVLIICVHVHRLMVYCYVYAASLHTFYVLHTAQISLQYCNHTDTSIFFVHCSVIYMIIIQYSCVDR